MLDPSGAARAGAPELVSPGADPPAGPGGSTMAGRLLPLTALLAMTVAVTVRDPHQGGSWGVCPTYAIFGVYCPGCGSLRGLHDLAAGQVSESVGHNALLIPAIAFLLVAAFRRPGRLWSWFWLVLFLGFTVLRNLPGSPLAP